MHVRDPIWTEAETAALLENLALHPDTMERHFPDTKMARDSALQRQRAVSPSSRYDPDRAPRPRSPTLEHTKLAMQSHAITTRRAALASAARSTSVDR